MPVRSQQALTFLKRLQRGGPVRMDFATRLAARKPAPRHRDLIWVKTFSGRMFKQTG
jgi:hypothetical protein